MKFFYFLTQKKFYVHLGIAIISTFLLLLLVFQFLKSYSYYGEAITVPDFTGYSVDKLDGINDLNNFTFIVTDSVFEPDRESGTVISQNPLAQSKVKRNRKIYVTVVSMSTEMVRMPNLVDLSLRQALDRLEMAGLKINYLHYIPDFAQDAVLAQLYNGDTIYADSQIQINSKIDLVLGKRNDQRKLLVPLLIGLTKAEAEKKIFEASFNLGKETYLEDEDRATMRVYSQTPTWNTDQLLNHGDFINLWYRSTVNFDFKNYLEYLTIDTLAVDSVLMDPLVDTIY